MCFRTMGTSPLAERRRKLVEQMIQEDEKKNVTSLENHGGNGSRDVMEGLSGNMDNPVV